MHTLVTGGGGFLGRAILEQLLARGDQVRSFSRGDYPVLTKLGVEVVRGDIQDVDVVVRACAGVDCVIHTAAIAGIGGPWRRFYAANTVGTQNVIAACRRQGVSRLVYTSSPSVTFRGRDQSGVTEREVPIDLAWLERNGCHYSRSKALAEQAVLAANSETLSTCALRPHLIWGPGDPHLVPRLIQRARNGRLRRVGNGTNLVDVIYVENAAAAHLQAADALSGFSSSVAGNAYFLSQGEPVNCWRWIDEILALANLSPVTKSISLDSAWRVGRVCEWVYRMVGSTSEPPMTRFLAWQLSCSHWFDISAARQDFAYQPLVSTTEGMQRLGQWLREP